MRNLQVESQPRTVILARAQPGDRSRKRSAGGAVLPIGTRQPGGRRESVLLADGALALGVFAVAGLIVWQLVLVRFITSCSVLKGAS